MADDMVMRSVYVRPMEDAQLRQLAHDLGVTKSDLIRSAIAVRLKEWLADNAREKVRADLAFGQRDTSIQREVKRAKPDAALRVAAPAKKAHVESAAKPGRAKAGKSPERKKAAAA